MNCGIIYCDPPEKLEDKISYEDLTRDELESFNLVGLPVYIEHEADGKMQVGHITEQFKTDDGKYGIRYEYHKNKNGGFAKGLVDNNILRSLSLSHALYNDGSVEPVEVSLCMEGKRDGTHILSNDGNFAPIYVSCSRKNQQKSKDIYTSDRIKRNSIKMEDRLNNVDKKLDLLASFLLSGKTKSSEGDSTQKDKTTTQQEQSDNKSKKVESEQTDDKSNTKKRKMSPEDGQTSNKKKKLYDLDKDTMSKFRGLLTDVSTLEMPEEQKENLFKKIGDVLGSVEKFSDRVASANIEQGRMIADNMSKLFGLNVDSGDISATNLNDEFRRHIGDGISNMDPTTRVRLGTVVASKLAEFQNSSKSNTYNQLMDRLNDKNPGGDVFKNRWKKIQASSKMTTSNKSSYPLFDELKKYSHQNS